ncbi:MAG: hypothetical protein IIB56_01375 [Planctomycetes bacterium]|nr:hypothetical protein [Planctomycetota bacterium]
MYCPKCNKENPDDARVCQSCSASLEETSESKQPVTVGISRLSIIALVLAVLSIFVFFPPLVLLFRVPGRLVLFLPLLAVILGIISIVRIERSGGKVTGRIFAVAAVLIPVFAGLLLVLIFSYAPRRSTAYRMVCGTNLSGIGKAMLMYSNDYDDEFPRAGGKNGVWSNNTPDWLADSQFVAYGLNADGTGGSASISSSLYLLLKYEYVVDRQPNYAAPKFFVCKPDSGTTEFKPSKYGVRDKDLIDLWDFGPEPTKHCSYSYHIPYGPYALTTSYLPGMAVAADRNPWIRSPFAKAKDISRFNPDGDKKAVKAGNSVTHKGEGQNVLFVDGHAAFERLSFCGINDDNIYTYWDGPDIRRGAIPNLKSQPAGRLDSMLVNDLP